MVGSTVQLLAFGATVLLAICTCTCKDYSNEEEAREFILDLDNKSAIYANKIALAEWAYASNITNETLAQKLEVSKEVAKFTKEQWVEVKKYPWTTFKDEDLKRMFQKSSILKSAALPADKYEKLEKLISDMQGIYSMAKICDFKQKEKCDLSLEPELTEVLIKSRDPEELKYVWVEWRKATGQKVKNMYQEYVSLSNEAAHLNNFSDSADLWLEGYEQNDFQEQVAELWKQLKPMYQQLHAYVRRKLREAYGEKIVSKRGPIPAHLLGNMWSQTWGSIFDFTAPYPGKPTVDVTPEMVKQGYTPEKMFKLSEQFFTSLNLSAMPETFWKNSLIQKPTDREIICHASAWDFYDGKDFRIKQCTRVQMRNLFTVHHEMGHVQYFLQYKSLPRIYRRGANPGFHEAVGDVMALSVSTPKHLRKIGLMSADSTDDPEATINYLYIQGLDKIAFLPFGYLMDLWRWDVFKGKTTPDNYNCHWWRLREEYQGLEPPVHRTEEDFDPGAKYHTIASVPYIRYFVSFVIQFQFHKALCAKAGQNGPLHECDIYQSTEAGNLLGKMLQMGSSKPWPEAMEVITGQRKMDASGLLEYFDPLLKWLIKENARTNEFIGWEPTNKHCVQNRSELEDLERRSDITTVST